MLVQPSKSFISPAPRVHLLYWISDCGRDSRNACIHLIGILSDLHLHSCPSRIRLGLTSRKSRAITCDSTEPQQHLDSKFQPSRNSVRLTKQRPYLDYPLESPSGILPVIHATLMITMFLTPAWLSTASDLKPDRDRTPKILMSCSRKSSAYTATQSAEMTPSGRPHRTGRFHGMMATNGRAKVGWCLASRTSGQGVLAIWPMENSLRQWSDLIKWDVNIRRLKFLQRFREREPSMVWLWCGFIPKRLIMSSISVTDLWGTRSIAKRRKVA